MKNEKYFEEIVILIVDRITMNYIKYSLAVPRELEEEKQLDLIKKAVRVGSFVIIKDKTFRRVRGGFNLADDEDIAELLASSLSKI